MRPKYWLVPAIFLTACAPMQMNSRAAAENAEKWGILGTWKPDCQAAASDRNLNYSYIVREDQLYLDRSTASRRDLHPIISATVTGDGALDLVIDFEEAGKYENTIVKGSDGRIRVMQNKNMTTDEYTVKDGMVVNGGPTLWAAHCR